MTMERNVWRLKTRPNATAKFGELEYRREPVPQLQDGQFLIDTLYLSIDPTDLVGIQEIEQYFPPVQLGAVMRGVVVGRVLQSRKADVTEGDLYMGIGEWADKITTDGTFMSRVVPPKGMPLSMMFGVFSLVGPTAYFGLLDIGKPKPGETLVVSAAAGGVGQIVGQIGKIHGCRVIGIAGGVAKGKFITDELGFDAAIDYKNEDVGARLDALAPDGVDINFEQVGGSIMEAVMQRMRLFGRVPLCGMISTYANQGKGYDPSAWVILMRRLTVKGFIVVDYHDRFGEATEALARWMGDGRLKARQDIRVGLENAFSSTVDLHKGANLGKLMVQVSSDAARL
jgi:hypothetical protein